ncbi:hypothetical protein EYF80_045719 [Liparis tanakae]|uniref:Uncharacterized protein n=1 Tax=Liparis tanakae TaxID=230148 RepID=A0A4Z2FTK5_9TELE|nr:hypothetical protein EYF80_045719 [Liparis tanakae]
MWGQWLICRMAAETQQLPCLLPFVGISQYETAKRPKDDFGGSTMRLEWVWGSSRENPEESRAVSKRRMTRSFTDLSFLSASAFCRRVLVTMQQGEETRRLETVTCGDVLHDLAQVLKLSLRLLLLLLLVLVLGQLQAFLGHRDQVFALKFLQLLDAVLVDGLDHVDDLEADFAEALHEGRVGHLVFGLT